MKKKYRFNMHNWQGKGSAFADALLGAGFMKSNYPGGADLLLTDFDQNSNYERFLQGYRRNRKLVWCLYPHSARPVLMWDGCFEPKKAVSMNFVVNEYHQEILRASGYHLPTFPVGWSLCPIREFSPRKKIQQVVFAPIHPNNNGWLSDLDKTINAKAERILASLSQKMKFHLKIRHIKDMAAGGLSGFPGVEYVQVKPDGSTDDILSADIVVSHQTFAYMAVALGVPTVMYAEDTPARCGNSRETLRFADNWDAYRDLVMYPIDLFNGSAERRLKEAAEGSWKVEDWKRRMIGSPFSPDVFISKVMEILSSRS